MTAMAPRTIALSALLRQARYEAGLSVEDLAGISDVSASTLRRIESGTSEARRETMRRALAACDDVTNGGDVSP